MFSSPRTHTATRDQRKAPVLTEPIVLDAPADLATGGSAELFSGADHGVDVSFFLNHAVPGGGAEAHRHPYAEVFVVLAGDVVFTVDGRDQAARGGHVVVVPAGAAHAFRNTGEGTLEMISIHPVAAMETEWLEASS
jgi:quercetin dioxygenase-like cupin family protein